MEGTVSLKLAMGGTEDGDFGQNVVIPSFSQVLKQTGGRF